MHLTTRPLVPTRFRAALGSRAEALTHAVTWLLLGSLIVGANATRPGGDFWVRLASGRLVVDERAIPRHDPFSFTARGSDWLDHEWILGTAMYLLNRASYEALLFAGATLALMPFALMYWRFRDRAGGWWLLLGVCAVAAVVSSRNFGLRPQLVNPLLFVAVLLMIDEFRRRGGTQVWAIVPVMWVWANLQAGFMVGLALIAAWAVACMLERNARGTAIGVLALASAVALANPYGTGLYEYTLTSSLSGNPDRTYVAEWRSIDFHDPLNLPVFLGLLALPWLELRRGDWLRRLLLMGTLGGALMSARFVPFFAISAIYVLAPNLPRRSAPRWLVLTGLGAGPIAIALALVILTGTATRRAPLEHEPVEALAFLREIGGEPPRVYTSNGWGSFLAYERYPVFVDTRTHQAYPDAVLDDYYRVETARGAWEAVLERWCIDYVLFPRDTALAEALDHEAWPRVFEARDQVIWRSPGGSNSGSCAS